VLVNFIITPNMVLNV